MSSKKLPRTMFILSLGILLSVLLYGAFQTENPLAEAAVWPLGWHSASNLPQPLSWFGAVNTGNNILVIGGRNQAGNPVSAVYTASILPNGNLGAWRSTTSLPKPLLGHSVAKQGDSIYVLGGWNQGQNDERTVYYSNAQYLTWRQGEPLPTDLHQGAAVATSTHLYYIGGYNLSHRQVVNTVYLADITASGRPEHWRATRALPAPLYRHAALIYDDRLYVVGGSDGHNPSQWVYFAKIFDNGTLGPWQLSSLPTQRDYPQTIVYNNRFMVLGGRRENHTVLARIDMADFVWDGSLTNWRQLDSLPHPLYKFGVVKAERFQRDYLFVLGGRDQNDAYRSEVYHSDLPTSRLMYLPSIQRHPTPTPTPTPTLTPTPTPTPTPATPDSYLWWQEAEDGHPVPPIGLASDKKASACRYMDVVDDFSDGGAAYFFSVPSAGSFTLWVRVKGKDYNADSLFYSLDDGARFVLNIPRFNGSWTWGWISLFGGRAQRLDRGIHTLRIYSREAGSSFDTILVTGIPGYVPDVHAPCISLPPEPMGLVPDGSFENGPPPASAWEEKSNTACEWIGNFPSVWDDVTAYQGQNYFWGGGYCRDGEVWRPASTYVRQLAYVPKTDATLYFHYLLQRGNNDDPIPEDYAYITINGKRVWRKDLIQANNTRPHWRPAQIDLSAYAGQIVDLRLGVISEGDLTGNILFDYIQLGRGTDEQGMPSPLASSTPQPPTGGTAIPALARTPVPKFSSGMSPTIPP